MEFVWRIFSGSTIVLKGIVSDWFPSGDVCLGGSRYDVIRGNHGVCHVLGRADAWSTCSGVLPRS